MWGATRKQSLGLCVLIRLDDFEGPPYSNLICETAADLRIFLILQSVNRPLNRMNIFRPLALMNGND